MDSTAPEIENRSKNRIDSNAERIRSEIRNHSKLFKTSWVSLGQALHAVWQDKIFYAWGYDKFEHYVEREVGLHGGVDVRLTTGVRAPTTALQLLPAQARRQLVGSRLDAAAAEVK